jgi:hypothetical protein
LKISIASQILTPTGACDLEIQKAHIAPLQSLALGDNQLCISMLPTGLAKLRTLNIIILILYNYIKLVTRQLSSDVKAQMLLL